MPFMWIQNIAIDADIDSADIVEIRDAADSVLDNLCVVDNVGEDNGHDGLDNGAEDGTDNNLQNGVENADHNPAENGDDNGAEDSVENSDDNPALNGTDNGAEDDGALGLNEAPDDTGEDTTADSPDFITAHEPHHTDHNPEYCPGHVSLELAGDDGDHKTDV